MIKESTLIEINNLKFIQDKVSCAKYINHFEKDNKIYLETETINGETLSKICSSLNKEEIVIVSNNIIKEIIKLRNIKFDKIVEIKDYIYGELKFKNEKELNKNVCEFVKNKIEKDIIIELLPKNSKFVLSHGDLHPENIIVKNDLSVYFIDWENMGLLPDYWDPMKLFVLCNKEEKVVKIIIEKLNVNKSALICHLQITRNMFL